MIVFYRFSDYIRRHQIKRKDIIKDTGISSATLANMTANKGVSTETIAKLCEYLKCQPEEIMEYIVKEKVKNA